MKNSLVFFIVLVLLFGSCQKEAFTPVSLPDEDPTIGYGYTPYPDSTTVSGGTSNWVPYPYIKKKR